jgi:hypothetical protein
MFSVIIIKATNKILFAHQDGSVGMNKPLPQERLEQYCEDNGLDANDYLAIEYVWDLKNPINISKHIYNPANGQIEVDPNWVKPTPIAPTEPTE